MSEIKARNNGIAFVNHHSNHFNHFKAILQLYTFLPLLDNSRILIMQKKKKKRKLTQSNKNGCSYHFLHRKNGNKNKQTLFI